MDYTHTAFLTKLSFMGRRANIKLLDLLLTTLPRLPEVNPEELTAAGGAAGAIDLRNEGLGRRYACSLCRSAVLVHAIIVEPTLLSGYRQRWLDVCPPCHRDVQDLAAAWPGDDFVLERLAQLRAA